MQAHLEALLVPAIEAAGYRLVRFRVMGGARKTLQVMAERNDGHMDVEDCANLSRALSDVLETVDPIEGEYVLEISSPGIDRPLICPEDFSRFAGHEARLELKTGIEGRKRFRGTLIGVENDAVVMDVPVEKGAFRMTFPIHDIGDAKLVLTDKLIQENLKAKGEEKSPH